MKPRICEFCGKPTEPGWCCAKRRTAVHQRLKKRQRERKAAKR